MGGLGDEQASLCGLLVKRVQARLGLIAESVGEDLQEAHRQGQRCNGGIERKFGVDGCCKQIVDIVRERAQGAVGHQRDVNPELTGSADRPK